MIVLLTVFWRVSLAYGAFVTVERIFRYSKPVSTVPHWWPRLAFIAGIELGLMALALAAARELFTIDLPVLAGARAFWMNKPWVVAFICLILLHSFIFYWVHRLVHGNLLWRVHQMHHSPERFEVLINLYAHPLDFIIFSSVNIGTVLLGGFTFSHFLALVGIHEFTTKIIHMRIRTPRWLGYFVFRPEQHAMHHSEHNVNHGIIPIWDQIFGTFENSLGPPAKVGLSREAQGRFWAMFFLRKTD